MMKVQSRFAACGRWALQGGVCLTLLCACSGPPKPNVSGKPHLSSPADDAEIQPDLPPTAKTLYAMADLLARQGKDAECEFSLRRCIREHAGFIPAYNRLAELLMRQGRVHEAIDTLSEASRLRPQDPVLANNLGMCRLVRKQYPQALEQFTKAAGLVPESVKYRANMATTLGLLGRQEESLALLQQILPADQAQHNAEVLRRAYEKQASPAPTVQG